MAGLALRGAGPVRIGYRKSDTLIIPKDSGALEEALA